MIFLVKQPITGVPRLCVGTAASPACRARQGCGADGRHPKNGVSRVCAPEAVGRLNAGRVETVRCVCVCVWVRLFWSDLIAIVLRLLLRGVQFFATSRAVSASPDGRFDAQFQP
jgi:hypothetical protein